MFGQYFECECGGCMRYSYRVSLVDFDGDVYTEYHYRCLSCAEWFVAVDEEGYYKDVKHEKGEGE